MYINEAIERNHITPGSQVFGPPLFNYYIYHLCCAPDLARRGSQHQSKRTRASQQPTDLHNERYYSRYRVATSRLWYCNGKIKRKGIGGRRGWLGDGRKRGKGEKNRTLVSFSLSLFFFIFCARENEGLNPLLSPNFPRTFRKLFRGTFKAFSDGKKGGKKNGETANKTG